MGVVKVIQSTIWRLHLAFVKSFQHMRTWSVIRVKPGKLQYSRSGAQTFKDKDYCPIEIIKGLTDKGQFQYLTKLMGPREWTYLYATQFHSLR